MADYSRMSTEHTYHPQEANEPLKVKLKTWERVIYNSVFHFFLLLMLCSIIGIGTPIIWGMIWEPPADLTLESDFRYDCLPLRSTWNISAETCPMNSKACLWDEFATPDQIQCYYAKEKANEGDTDRTGKLPRYVVNKTVYYNADKNLPVKHYLLDLLTPAPFLNKNNTDITKNPVIEQRLIVEICHYSEDHLSIHIRPEHEEYNVWNSFLDLNYPTTRNCTLDNAKLSKVDISVATNTKESGLSSDIFQLQVNRKSTGKSIFNMGPHTPFIYSKGFIEITTMLINDFVWGLGESYSERFRHNFSQPRSWTLYSQFNDKELNENSTSMYGSHPFYLGVDDPDSGDSYGVLLVNTHPLEISINARPSLSFKTFGGHLEFHFFMGPRPADVLSQLQRFIHKPVMPPYWALGFHVCAATCSIPSPTLSQSLIQANIPVESDCGTSLRKAGDKRQFEIFKNNLQKSKFFSIEIPQRFESNPSSNLFKKSLRQLNRDSPFSGSVQACDSQNVLNEESVTYPDFFNSDASKEYEMSEEFLKFADGYVLDRNTPLNSRNVNGTLACPLMMTNYHWNSENFANLTRQTLCLDSRLSESDFSKDLHLKNPSPFMGDYFALHNLYGYQHTKTVYEIVQKITETKRPFILSLSTFLGSGRYGGHVGIYINSTWETMRMTLKQTLDFSLFGISMSGYPVGGSRGSRPSDELLRRWFQLSSLQPIFFAHSDFETEPRVLREGSVRETIRTTIQTRYRLLPYLYTQFWRASTKGDSVVKPLFFEFYNDINSYSINNQYMLGPALMVSPALNESDTSLDVYFPKGQRWYEYFSGHLEAKAQGGFREVSSVEQNAPLHIRGGYAIMTHARVLTSIDEMRKISGFQVIAALDKQTAKGDFYLDNGITQDERNLQVNFEFHYSNITINMANNKQFCETNSQDSAINTILSGIRMYGVIDKPYHNYSDNAVASLYRNEAFHSRISAVTYQNNFGVLSLDVNLNLCDAQRFFINWTYPSWQHDPVNEQK